MPFEPATRTVPIEPTASPRRSRRLSRQTRRTRLAWTALPRRRSTLRWTAAPPPTRARPSRRRCSSTRRARGPAAALPVRPFGFVPSSRVSCSGFWGESSHHPYAVVGARGFSPRADFVTRTQWTRGWPSPGRNAAWRDSAAQRRRFVTNDMDPIELGIDRMVVSSWAPDDSWPATLEGYGVERACRSGGRGPAPGGSAEHRRWRLGRRSRS